MKIRVIGFGALAGALLTAALTSILYLANQLLGLPFPPYDLFNWVTRILPGDLVTFGIDTMINALLLVGMNVAETAKTAERASAILQFVAIGTVAGAIYFAVMKWRNSSGERLAGLIAGGLFGLPVAGISMAITQSDVSPILSLSWVIVAFLLWAAPSRRFFRRTFGGRRLHGVTTARSGQLMQLLANAVVSLCQ